VARLVGLEIDWRQEQRSLQRQKEESEDETGAAAPIGATHNR
jgi:hypothetical protein